MLLTEDIHLSDIAVTNTAAVANTTIVLQVPQTDSLTVGRNLSETPDIKAVPNRNHTNIGSLQKINRESGGGSVSS